MPLVPFDYSQSLRGARGAPTTKFVVQPYHRNLSDDVLLADLTRVANILRATALSQTAYMAHGRFAFVTYCRRFGSWKSALMRVNLEPAHLMNVSADALLNDIRRVALKLETDRLRYSQYEAHGRYSRKIIYRLFGRWQTAAEAARLTPVIVRPQSVREMFDDLQAVWNKLGRQPRYVELRPPLSKFSASTYAYRFGSFRKALQAFAHEMDPAEVPAPVLADRSKGFNRPGPRTINLRLRFAVLQRDHFRCCACGRSPATHPLIHLQVDHIVPWSKGGKTVLENLQTLCGDCNSGKSDVM
jgi:hypothetical protein